MNYHKIRRIVLPMNKSRSEIYFYPPPSLIYTVTHGVDMRLGTGEEGQVWERVGRASRPVSLRPHGLE